DRLAEYDVGVFILKPINFNYEWALPNKLFDFVQARLGVIVGPSAEMAEVVRAGGFGVVTENFSPNALAQTLNNVRTEQVDEWKQRAHAAAHALSAEEQVIGWKRAIDRLARGK
ncbi:glycosyltransferase family 1 protein, partial [Leucobacter sp. M11]|nr:glycosyltransferase family 1 protein [Leucobacter sp. M11]